MDTLRDNQPVLFKAICSSLAKGKRERKQPEEIQYRECGMHFLPANSCASYGDEDGQHYAGAIGVHDAELKELDRKGRLATKRGWSMDGKAQFFGELETIEANSGYSSGWAAHQLPSRFGVRHNQFRHISPLPPSLETKGCVQLQLIRFWQSRT